MCESASPSLTHTQADYPEEYYSEGDKSGYYKKKVTPKDIKFYLGESGVSTTPDNGEEEANIGFNVVRT